MIITEEQRRRTRCKSLRHERSSWMAHWREISEYQQPRLGRFFVNDVNKGQKRHLSIYDSTAIAAARTLAAGMLSGSTNPARPWFKLELVDSDLMTSQAVKLWLYKTTNILLSIFAQSNTYRALQQIYEELGLFGTAACAVLPDFDNVIHHYPMTVGEYAIGTNAKGQVDTLMRELSMSVGQIVGEFGLENCSSVIKSMYDRGNVDAWVPVTHLIEPNTGRDNRKLDNKNMKFTSCYFETSKLGDPANPYLRESGFKTFPALVPRWAITGNDIYGNSPGMEALGDAKQLQHEQLRKSQVIDYQTLPPLQVPTQYRDAAKNRLPGGIMYVDSTSNNAGIKSAFEVNLNISHLLNDIEDVRGRIRNSYFADLFLMLANDTRSNVSATEVAARQEEKLIMLGPVYDRLKTELHQPLVEIAFSRAVEAGILPPAPKELENVELSVKFISTLAQAQRAVSGQGTDRLFASLGVIAQFSPSSVEKIDFDQAVDNFADLYNVDPAIIVPDEVLEERRAARAKQMEAEKQMAAMPAMADAAKTVGDTNIENISNAVAALG